MNEKPKESDAFIIRKIYRYTFSKPKVSTIIHAEIYPYNICVISFFTKKQGNNKTRFKLRFQYNGIHVLRIFQACLDVYIQIQSSEHYALFFTASNDLGEYKEDNERNSAYTKFFENYLPGYHSDYQKVGTLKLNIMGILPNVHLYPDRTIEFYRWFIRAVEEDMNEPEEDGK